MNSVITRGQKKKDDGFEYNKDADILRCPMGYLAINKILIPGKKYKTGYSNPTMQYSFAKENCKKCPRMKECLGKTKDRGRRYVIKILTEEHKEQEEFEQTEYFNNTLKKERYKIEAKNAETKIAHGLCKAKSVGLKCMRIQSYLAHITANIKRIIKKMDEVPV